MRVIVVEREKVNLACQDDRKRKIERAFEVVSG